MVQTTQRSDRPVPGLDPDGVIASHLRTLVQRLPKFYLRSRAYKHGTRHCSVDIQVAGFKEGASLHFILSDFDITIVCDLINFEMYIPDGRHYLRNEAIPAQDEPERVLFAIHYLAELTESRPPLEWRSYETAAVRVAGQPAHDDPSRDYR